MPSREQLESALVNADRAGDVEAAKRIATAIKTGDYYEQGAQKTQEKPMTTRQKLERIDQDFMSQNPNADFGSDEFIFRGLSDEKKAELLSRVVNRDRYKAVNPFVQQYGQTIPKEEDQKIRMANLERLRQANPSLAETIEESGAYTQAGAGFIEGLRSLYRGVGGNTDEDIDFYLKQLTSNKPLAGAGKIAGQTAPFIVPGAAISNISSAPLRIAAGAGLGASEGNIIARGEGQNVAAGTGLGLLVGTLGEAAIPVLNRAARQRLDVTEAVTPDGQPTQALQDALQREGTDFDSFARELVQEAGDPQANARRQAVFEDVGLTPTEAQRTRDADLFVQQQDAFRRSGRVKDVLEEQEQTLDTVVRGAQESTGGTAQAASVSPIEAITNKAIDLDNTISNLYRQAREAAPNENNIRFLRSAQLLRNRLPIDTRTNGTVSALREEMRRLGFLDENYNPTRRTNVQAAENLRQYANSLFEGADPLARGVIRDFKDQLDQDVLTATGDDLFEQARRAKSDFERGLDPVKRNKFDQRAVSLVRDIRDNLVSEDELIDKVLRRTSKYKASDVRELRNYLTSGSPQQVQQGLRAWNDIRAAAFERIRERAFKGPMTQRGTQSMSRAGLESAIREIGPQKFNELFSQAERDFIRRLHAVSVLREPPPGTFTGSGPSSPAIQRLESVMRRIPLIGESAVDLSRGIQNRVSEARVLNLVDDAERALARSERDAEIAIRRAAGGLPAAATAGAVSSEEETRDGK